ncbi:hypothetical protein A2594_02905 [Candidatus Woesebacteria bacterium RIFOXYD1_FULL_41_28]|uniref:Uncharacterized protein n=1 Tax=Candidatus Woesebacteria bacterium RIFOXYD1_FULL_41_28 TaxID=1802550 RepID=A0A1F8DGS3_9BACT|nr:MAG: hypothetical protein A2594_02905 [Candidatus Woesebacteria bacterium RIFOXYD1_FULL_41_28]
MPYYWYSNPLVNKIFSSLTPGIDFVKTYLYKIVFVVISIVIFYFVYWITSYSLKKLKPEIYSYYPFDKFFPKSGKWSIFYFLITIVFLGILVYAIIKGGFYLAPA